MKKGLLLLGAAALIFGATSCKKDYDCTCTQSGVSETYTFVDVKKADAEDACDVWNTLYALGGGSCSLD